MESFILSWNHKVVNHVNEIKLSERLCAICERLLPNKILADIGTDHAYLPSYAYLKGIIPCAIGTDVNEGPYESARTHVNNLGLSQVIDIRLGDGLAVIRENEVEQVTIAGMGGALITSILEDGKAKLAGVERLILQPNVATDKVRRWLYANDWTICDECILEEDQIIYEIIVANRGKDDRHFVEIDFLFGPYLNKEKSVAFQKKWKAELKKQENILLNLNKADRSEEVDALRQTIERKIKYIKEALT